MSIESAGSPRPTASARRSDYLPTLDGWRAVAIAAVLCDHANLLSIGALNDRWLYNYGYEGVDVFFAISGLLICWRLMQEEQQRGHISLRDFYIRRAFRILPPALFVLLVMAFLSALHVIRVGRMEWLAAAFFFRNYPSLLGHLTVYPYFTSHFWSLSVYEHFFLLLPGLLLLTRKRFRFLVLGFLTSGIVVHRTLVLQHRPYGQVESHTDIRLDGLLFPAMLAVLVQVPAVRELVRKALRFWPVLTVAALVVSSFDGHPSFDATALVFLFSLMVLGSVLNPQTLGSRALEWGPLRFVGRISYSLYLWQQLFFTGHFFGEYPLGILNTFPWQLFATVACALLSYYLLERPAIRFGHRFAPSATPGR